MLKFLCRRIVFLPFKIYHSCKIETREPAHPDMLQIFAVNRIKDAVGSYKLYCTFSVYVGHNTTLFVLQDEDNTQTTTDLKNSTKTYILITSKIHSNMIS